MATAGLRLEVPEKPTTREKLKSFKIHQTQEDSEKLPRGSLEEDSPSIRFSWDQPALASSKKWEGNSLGWVGRLIAAPTRATG